MSLTFIGTNEKHHPTPVAGEMRFNTDTKRMESYDGNKWSMVTIMADASYYLEIDEGRVFGAKYHTVAPINAEFVWGEMMSWMVETFGPTISIWEDSGARWYANNAKFLFKHKKDMDWFVLRWMS